MQQYDPTKQIAVFITHDDIKAGLTRLLRSAGITISDSDNFDEIESYIQEKTILVFTTPDNDSSVLDEIINFARNHQESLHCCIVPSRNAWVIQDDLSKQPLQLSIRREKQRTLGEVERDYIVKTLDDTEWQYKTGAKILGINRSTLYRKLKKYGLLKNGQKP